jgi:Icc protein
MRTLTELPQPAPPVASGIVSWAHVGDLHLTTADQQNRCDLLEIVERINQHYSDLNFVFLPGNHGEQGDPPAYALVRSALDRLRVPWFSIIGDHDVHTGTFAPYRAAMLPAAWPERHILGTQLGPNKNGRKW